MLPYRPPPCTAKPRRLLHPKLPTAAPHPDSVIARRLHFKALACFPPSLHHLLLCQAHPGDGTYKAPVCPRTLPSQSRTYGGEAPTQRGSGRSSHQNLHCSPQIPAGPILFLGVRHRTAHHLYREAKARAHIPGKVLLALGSAEPEVSVEGDSDQPGSGRRTATQHPAGISASLRCSLPR